MTDLERAEKTYRSIAFSSSTTVHMNAWAAAFAEVRRATVEQCAQMCSAYAEECHNADKWAGPTESPEDTARRLTKMILAIAPTAKEPT